MKLKMMGLTTLLLTQSVFAQPAEPCLKTATLAIQAVAAINNQIPMQDSSIQNIEVKYRGQSTPGGWKTFCGFNNDNEYCASVSEVKNKCEVKKIEGEWFGMFDFSK